MLRFASVVVLSLFIKSIFQPVFALADLGPLLELIYAKLAFAGI